MNEVDEVKSFDQSDIYVLIQTLVYSCARLYESFWGAL